MTDSKIHTMFSSTPPVSRTGHGGGGGDLSERVAALGKHTMFLATREDIANLKTDIANLRIWILGGILSTIFIVLLSSGVISKWLS
ncbi:MAG: hypothetical protein ACNYPF_01285 [Candidatus Puniceispirillales bacterium WSBS_2018_MAG_OTU23]